MMNQFAFLDSLMATIVTRAGADPETSYVAKLLQKGTRRIAKKVGEEGVEVALAAVAQPKAKAVSESADLLFHLLVLWQSLGITPGEVAQEFIRREGVSGLAEKAARPKD